jgi:hypothetical protein
MAEMIQGYAALQRRIAAIKGPVLGKDIMSTLGHAALNEIGNLEPHKTGNLRRSTHLAEVTATSARIVASANYARAQNSGSGLYGPKGAKYEIKPNAKKALAFASQGGLNRSASLGLVPMGSKLTFRLTGSLTSASMRQFGNAAFTVVKKVMHPGVRGQHFMENGAQKAITSAGLLDRVVAAWNKAA